MVIIGPIVGLLGASASAEILLDPGTIAGDQWPDILTLATEGEPCLTGYVDMVKVGPDELVLIAGVGGGTYVYPIRVTRAGLGSIFRIL